MLRGSRELLICCGSGHMCGVVEWDTGNRTAHYGTRWPIWVTQRPPRHGVFCDVRCSLGVILCGMGHSVPWDCHGPIELSGRVTLYARR